MNYPSIRIEGSIFSPDIVDRLDEAIGQRPGDFGLDSSAKVKDEIARAWADAQDYWRIFQRKLETVKVDSPATTETRSLWIVPLMSLLGYNLERESRGKEVNDKNYPISHRVANRANTPIHVIGYNEPGGLDRKPERAALRMSAHAMLQEFLNLSEDLYGLVTNGHVLRLLRDSSRLIKLTYLEFDLDRIFTDGLFADFAILYRLLHASRLPTRKDAVAESLLERYHQDSLDSGSRIREGLSKAVESAIIGFGNGFLAHPENQWLQDEISSGRLKASSYYQHLLRLIYRLLFLMVIEERGLVFPPGATSAQRNIYQSFYSVQRVRRLSERRYLADKRKHDLWLSLLATFRLFEAEGPGRRLGIAPLAGDLFSPNAISEVGQSTLSNDVVLGCLRDLSLYENPISKQKIRVNYAALNVEEFGSVYEGLLEYEPVFQNTGNRFSFALAQGDARSATGSHYTPDDLVQPLIKHSLDYLIADRLKASNPKQALLNLRVADISCGSGHILLAAARRIATELAILETGEDQPSPSAFRSAIREVIRNCIYGVDLNPLAVELCKVALWLEAHNPGEPLNFLDHHIKRGNAIIGYVSLGDVDRGIPDEAFKAQPGDDKDITAEFRKANKKERREYASGQRPLASVVEDILERIRMEWTALSAMPEGTPTEIEEKRARFNEFSKSRDALILRQLASIPIAQFYIPKTKENREALITHGRFLRYPSAEQALPGEASAVAWAESKLIFNWFLEFPEIIQRGGFDCILGNPPYLGGQGLSGTYGHSFCEFVKWEFAPTGLSDLVVFFVRRIYNLLCPNGFTAFITTNSIKDGDVRKDGLEQIIAQGGSINMAVRGVKWPGRANLVVSLLCLHKGNWTGIRALDGLSVSYINPFLEEGKDMGESKKLPENSGRIFQGSIFLGDGFLLEPSQAKALTEYDSNNADVVFPLVSGKVITDYPDQQPKRFAINFFERTEDEAAQYDEPFAIVSALVKPERLKLNPATAVNKRRRDFWWQWGALAANIYSYIKEKERCFVIVRHAKYLAFVSQSTRSLYTDGLNVFTTDRWDLYSVVQSTLHEIWARKYSGSLETRLRYSPSDCFETFPFPLGLWDTPNSKLAHLGEQYHEHRRMLIRQLWLGLTEVYNLFHTCDLTPERVAKVSKKPLAEAQAGYAGILELRKLRVELDAAVREAFGWDVPLEHGFYEVETLPENDRVRYTISSTARRELLKLFLVENHRRAAVEAGAAVTARPAKPTPPIEMDANLFSAMAYPSSAADQAICAASLSIVEQSGSISSQEHLDVLLLCTHPDWCNPFLSQVDQQSLQTVLSAAPAGLVLTQGQSVRWSDCRNYLEQLAGIEIDRNDSAQPIRTTLSTAAAKATLPPGTDAVVRYCLKALDRIRELQSSVNSPLAGAPSLSQTERMILEAFEEQHQLYQLAS